MVDDKSCSDSIKLANKGVNVTSDSFPPVAAGKTDFTSLSEVKTDLQAVIELMGPNTPHFNYNTSSEADNEDSIFSSVSGLSSIIQKKHVSKKPIHWSTTSSVQKRISEFNTPREGGDYNIERNNMISNHPKCEWCACSSGHHIFQIPPPPICVNPNCSCVHEMDKKMPLHDNNRSLHNSRKSFYEKNILLSRLFKKKHQDIETEPNDLYKINIEKAGGEHSPPRRLVFDLVDGVQKPEMNTVGINTSKPGTIVNLCETHTCFANIYPDHQGIRVHQNLNRKTITKHTACRNDRLYYNNVENFCGHDSTKIDIYYFDHGNPAFFRTTDSPPQLVTEILAEKTENYTTKFWAEIFGTIHIAFSFFTSFILQFFRFILYGLIRPLTIGLIQLSSDYFFKPFLTVIFNGFIQPPLIFFYNIATSTRDLLDPIAEGLGYFLREVAVIFKSIRFVEIKKDIPAPEKTKKKQDKINSAPA